MQQKPSLAACPTCGKTSNGFCHDDWHESVTLFPCPECGARLAEDQGSDQYCCRRCGTTYFPLSPFEAFVNKIAAVPKDAIRALEAARPKTIRRRKPKQPAK